MNELNKIIQGDCLEEMKKIPDKSIDMILADPPYNISKKNNFATMERYNKYKGMDFGEWDKQFDNLSWLNFLPRILKEGSNLVIFNSWQNLKEISDYLKTLDIIAKRILVLKKTNLMPVNRDRLFVNSFEFAIYATYGKKWTFNRRFDNYETGFFECRNNGVTKHPTEKQVSVFSDLITILSNEGDMILDPFAGSGTTGVACEKLKRNYILIEMNLEYVEIAKARIESWTKQLEQGELTLGIDK